MTETGLQSLDLYVFARYQRHVLLCNVIEVSDGEALLKQRWSIKSCTTIATFTSDSKRLCFPLVWHYNELF